MKCFRHDPGKLCPDCGLDRRLKCDVCKERREDIRYFGPTDQMICDSCYTDYMDDKEQANIDACHSNGEQDF